MPHRTRRSRSCRSQTSRLTPTKAGRSLRPSERSLSQYRALLHARTELPTLCTADYSSLAAIFWAGSRHYLTQAHLMHQRPPSRHQPCLVSDTLLPGRALQPCSAAVLCSRGGALPDAHAHTPKRRGDCTPARPPAVIEAEKACPRHASGLRYIRAASLGTSALTAARSEPWSRGRVRARRTPTAELILAQVEADRPGLAESCSSGGHRAITWISP